MKKLSKVKTVAGNGTWNGNDGTMYYKFEYLMEDGALLSASHKTDKHFNEGDEVEYEITKTNEYGNYGKVSRPNDFRKKKDDDYVKGIEVGHAVNNAVNMLCAGLEFKDVPETNLDNKIYLYAKHILKISEQLKSEQ